MDLSEIWSTALRLSDAAWEFASPHQKERTRRAKTRGAFEAHTILIQQELIDKINSGEVVAIGMAIGIQRFPELGVAPEILPPILFTDNPEIDWHKSIVRAYGRVYEGVRIVRAESIAAKRAMEAAPTEPDAAPMSIDRAGKIAPKKLGRRPVVGLLQDIVRELHADESLIGLLQKQQVDRVASKARERYPLRFPRPSQPSRSSVLKALKAEGF